MRWVLTCPAEATEDSKRRHYAIVDGRVQEVEAGKYSFLSVVGSDQDVLLVRRCRRRGNMPGRSCGHWKVHAEEHRGQMVADRLGRSWADETHEDGGWVSERWRYCRS